MNIYSKKGEYGYIYLLREQQTPSNMSRTDYKMIAVLFHLLCLVAITVLLCFNPFIAPRSVLLSTPNTTLQYRRTIFRESERYKSMRWCSCFDPNKKAPIFGYSEPQLFVWLYRYSGYRSITREMFAEANRPGGVKRSEAAVAKAQIPPWRGIPLAPNYPTPATIKFQSHSSNTTRLTKVVWKTKPEPTTIYKLLHWMTRVKYPKFSFSWNTPTFPYDLRR